jgi:hypothetical protein
VRDSASPSAVSVSYLSNFQKTILVPCSPLRLRLTVRQPVLRAVASERQQKYVDTAIGLVADEIRGRQRSPRLAPGYLSLFQLRENALRDDLVDGRVRSCGFDGRGYGRTDVLTYNCGSHVAPPLCNSVRACRLLEQTAGPFLLSSTSGVSDKPRQHGGTAPPSVRQSCAIAF